MTNEEEEAYLWWNLRIEEKPNDSSPPNSLVPRKAFLAWSHICPYFQKFHIDTNDAEKYWEFIQKTVATYCPNEQVPNPVTNFPQFVLKLYQLRDLLQPKNVQQCVNLVNIYKPNCVGTFCLYDMPVYFLDPILYFKTLISLRYSNHILWKNVISNAKIVDAFFEMHSNFIAPLPKGSSDEFWFQRLCLTEILFLLIDSIISGNNTATIMKNHPKCFQFASKFIECCIKLAGNASLSLSAIFFRYAIRILKVSHNKIPHDQFKSLSVQLLKTLDKANSPLIHLAFKFVFQLKPLVVPYSRVLKMISNRGIRSLSDIEIVSSFCEGNCILPVIIFLCKSALSSKLWHRACFSEITTLLQKHSSRNDVRDWFQLFIRRLFIYIAIASSKMRYRTKTLLLVESLASIMTIRLLWLQQCILINAASMFSTKNVPPYFKNFFPISAPVDDVVVHEYESFSTIELNLKIFPFDENKGTLVLPPLVDIHNQHLPASQRSQGCRANSRNDRVLSGRPDGRVLKTGTQKKRPEPLIKKSAGTKPTRPLASAICVTPIHRR
ncbi:hypothetical protein TRFO_06934 [Tritrichomonas foetus]|uniref:Uncharacterized protein n=1 Tax=Tritrichomonas foetus TaxID=1144522 RepID=A0A1J4JV56_9EUKA|nr:hypothetical protein TRFO_06934 [Tritrichomonas foetus]|eukprot:OHT02883.1 hypothetical protein TRFO_06934 [Tritrichomonas foetus]